MKLRELIDLTGAELGMKASEVNTRARRIREEEFLRSGGRGTGAPDMQATDVSAMLLGMVSMADPVRAGADLSELNRATFFGCEWTDLHVASWRGADRLDTGAFKHAGAPPPMFDINGAESSPLGGLAKALELAAERPDVSIDYLEHRADRDGRTIEIVWLQDWAREEAAEAYIAATGDPTDRIRFAKGDGVSRWEIAVEYSLREPQREQRERVLRIPSEPINRIVQEALA